MNKMYFCPKCRLYFFYEFTRNTFKVPLNCPLCLSENNMKPIYAGNETITKVISKSPKLKIIQNKYYDIFYQ